MTPTKGTISLSDIRKELERNDDTISLGEYQTRALCGIMAGPISMSDLYGKRYKDSRMLGSSSVGGGNNSGGNFDLARWGWFKPGVEIVSFQMWASKYEKYLMFYQYGITFGGEGVMHYLPYPLKYDMNRTIYIPGSADWHSANYFGYKIYPDGLNK